MTRARISGYGITLAMALLWSCAGSPEARRDRFLAEGRKHLAAKDFTRAFLEFRNAAKATPRDAEPYYYLGLAAMQSGDLQNAVYSFQKALSLNPKHADARLQLTRIMAAAGDRPIVEDAVRNVKELIESAPVTPEMLATLAVAELRLGRPADAAQVLQQLLGTAPGELKASILLARARLMQRDVSGAEQVLKTAIASQPDSAEPQIALAQFYTSLNKTAEAEQALRRALQINARSASALFELAVLQNRRGEKKEAEAGFKQLSKIGEQRYKPIYAYFLISEGRQEEALREFEALAKADPADRAARTRLITAYRAADRIPEAQRVLEDVLANNPKDVDALLQRGQLLTAAGKYADAEADLNRVLQQRPDSPTGHYAMAKLQQARGKTLQYRQNLTKALELDPRLLFVRLELAGALIASGSPKSALDLLDKTPENQKSMEVLTQRNWALWASGDLKEMRKGIDAGLSAEKNAELLVQDGLWKLRTGNTPAARTSLEQALNINPGDLRALSGLKQSFLKEGKVSQALARVKEYAAHRPKSAPVQQFLGYMHWAAGDRAAARSAFMAAKAADPKWHQADLALVQLDAVDSKWDDAAARLNAMLVSDPGNLTSRMWLGIIEISRKNPAAALEQFRRAVEAAPDSPQALNNFAYLLSEHANKPDEALKYATKAQELAPNHPLYMGTLGWILYRNGLYPSALKYLERAAPAAKDPVVNYHLAMAYAKAGDVQRGRAALADALKRDPNLPEARMAKELLAAR